MSVGDFTLFISYLGWLTFVTNMFGDYLTRYRQVGVFWDRLRQLLPGAPPQELVQSAPLYLWGALPALPQMPKRAAQPLEKLVAHELTYHYPGTPHGISGIHLALRRNTLTVITGRVGAGKTTLLRVLLGLLPKATGTITWNDELVADPATFFVPLRTAYTPQAPRLFSESLRDNILLGLPVAQETLEVHCVRRVGGRSPPVRTRFSNDGWRTRRQIVGRTAATHRRRPDVCASARTADL
ncbi:MAG: ATP-binding cassette domain-containing protein [Caldilineaceae bacterium]